MSIATQFDYGFSHPHSKQSSHYVESPTAATLSVSPAAMFLSTFSDSSQKPPALPDDQGQTVQGYTLGPLIGYGATSIIRQATQGSSVAAVKIIRRSTLVKAGNAPAARKRLQHEASVWASLSHEHILPLFSAHHTEYADYFFTLYCPAGSLFDILKRDGRPMLEQDDAGMMFRQVVRGLRYLHTEARFVHRDIKLENILVDEMGVCRIGDFGMARRIGGGEMGMGCSEVDEDSFDDSFDEEEDEEALGMLRHGHHHPQMHVQRASSFTATKRPLRSSMNPHPHPHAHAHPQVSNHAFHRYNTVRVPRPRHSSTASQHPSLATNQPSTSLSGDNTSGSLPYAAPELLLPHTSQALRKNPHPGQDIWALGVVLYTLLTGALPWRDAFEPRLRMKILEGTYTAPPSIGLGAERILSGCLEKNMQARWTIERVDQVAWGVGWGSEGDGVAEDDEEEDLIVPTRSVVASASVSKATSLAASRDHSRSRTASSRPTPGSLNLNLDTLEVRDWHSTTHTPADYARTPKECAEDNYECSPVAAEYSPTRSRASLESASRRSSSRVQRSLSRAPVLGERPRRGASPGSAASPVSPISPSASGSAAQTVFQDRGRRRRERGHPRPHPNAHSYLSPSSASGSRSSSQSQSHSRSASPSMVPQTPRDGVVGLPSSVRGAGVEALLEHPDEVDADASECEDDAGHAERCVNAPGGDERRGRPMLRHQQMQQLQTLVNISMRDHVRVASGKDSAEDGGVNFGPFGAFGGVGVGDSGVEERGMRGLEDDIVGGGGGPVGGVDDEVDEERSRDVGIDVVRKNINVNVGVGIGSELGLGWPLRRGYVDEQDQEEPLSPLSPLPLDGALELGTDAEASASIGKGSGSGMISGTVLSAVSPATAGWRSTANSRPSSSPPVSRCSAAAGVAGGATPSAAAHTPAGSSTPALAHTSFSTSTSTAGTGSTMPMPMPMSIAAALPASPAVSFLNSFWGGAPAPALSVRSRSGH